MDLSAVATGPFSPTDVHTRLARLTGRWTGTAKTYADPSNPEAADSAPWEGTIETLLGGRYLRFAYVSRAMGEPIAGELTIASKEARDAALASQAYGGMDETFGQLDELLVTLRS